MDATLEKVQVSQNGPLTVRLALTDENGLLRMRSEFTRIAYTIQERDPYDPNQYNNLASHTDQTIPNTALLESPGTYDGKSYNFEYTFPGYVTKLFPKRGWKYIVHLEWLYDGGTYHTVKEFLCETN